MGKILLTIVFMALTTLLGVYALAKKPVPPSPALASSESRVERIGDNLIAQEVADLRREVSLLKSDRVAQAVQRDSFSDNHAQLRPTPDESREAQERESQQYQRKLEGILRGQRRDPEWARATERKVEGTLVSYAPGTALDSVSCAATLCRVVVRHGDESTKKDFLLTVGQAEPFTAGTIYTYDAMVTTMYVIKDGEKPPAMSD